MQRNLLLLPVFAFTLEELSQWPNKLTLITVATDYQW